MKPHITDTDFRILFDLHCYFCVNNKVHPIEEFGNIKEIKNRGSSHSVDVNGNCNMGCC